MKFKGFEIVDFLIGEIAGFFSLKFEGEEKSEAEKFFEKYENVYPCKIENLIAKMEIQAEKRGCQDFLVHPERGSVWKFKEDNLRLYFLRFGNAVVILGGGGIKHVRATQDSKELTNIVENLEKAEKMINKRIINDKDLKIYGTRLLGDLKFVLD